MCLKDKIAPEKMEKLIEWLTEVLSKSFSEEIKTKIIDSLIV